MRLHRVEVQAFGPFAGRETVDVDALGAHGLFLLHGATGAGKTSVLDAVCFALYGAVPGARAGTTRLRSDHAAAGVAPEVVVELTVGSRRLEVTRSPSWERPKKRGAGTTTEPARTVVREWGGGTWQPVTSRNDEASQLLTDLLGMGLEQFTKVVLLPQGEFAAFLRAPAEQRLPLLQRLFGTDRFAAAEAWFADRRKELARRVEQADATVDRLIARVEQSVAALPPDPVPADSEVSDPDAADPESADSEAAAAHALARATRSLALHRGRVAASGASAEASRGTCEQLRDEVRRARRWDALVAEREALETADPDARRAESLLRTARAAASVAGELRTARTAEDDHAAARTAVNGAERTAGLRSPADLDSDDIPVAVARRNEELARLRNLVEVQADLDATGVRVEQLTSEVAAATAMEQVAAAEEADAGRQCDQHQAAVTGLADAGARQARAEQALAAAEARHRAARHHQELTEQVERLVAAVGAATDQAQDARQTWLDLRERRLAGMAAELSLDLVDGRPCPVCGGCEHPHPAAAAGRAVVTAEQERRAHRAADAAAGQRAQREADLAAVREQLAEIAAGAGGLREGDAAAELADARVALADAAEAVDRLSAHRSALVQQADRREAAARRVADQRARAAGARAQLDEVQRHADRQRAAIRAAVGDGVDLAERRTRVEAEVTALEDLRAARAAHEATARAARTARQRADEAARGAGFRSAEEALAALLSPGEVDALDAVVRAHADAWSAVRARCADDDMQRAAAEHAARLDRDEEPSVLVGALEAAEARVRQADEEHRAAVAAVALAQQATTAVADLLDHLAAEVAAAGPLRAEHALVFELAACTAGTGGSNALRMRLSSYVLAARLEQVAAAATVRLDEMSDGRYALVHSDALERGGRRSGLGLMVVDAWTGTLRDTASLSGGESFLASLALALGLADVVQAESGGTPIETLFVDEGFGTLDPETLEEVMAVLDALRDGGRCVGVVSHVQELRQRIPARLEVVRTRSGSHLRVERDAA